MKRNASSKFISARHHNKSSIDISYNLRNQTSRFDIQSDNNDLTSIAQNVNFQANHKMRISDSNRQIIREVSTLVSELNLNFSLQDSEIQILAFADKLLVSETP